MSDSLGSETQIDRLSKLYVAAVADALDHVGLRGNYMEPHIRPLWRGARIAGRVRTIRLVAVEAPPADAADNYRTEMAAVDGLTAGDVLVAAGVRRSFWGELLSTAAKLKGANGVVADAYVRDTRAVEEMGFPVFCSGISPEDSLGRIEADEFDVPLEIGGVLVHPGDLILADEDGVVVVPRAVADAVLEQAESKVAAENRMRADLAGGMRVQEAFERSGIL